MQNPFQTDWSLDLYARHWGKLWLTQGLLLLVVGFTGAWILKPAPSPMVGTGEATHASHDEGPKIWTCSMHPQIRRDRPGTCPICGMKLVPVTSSGGGMRTITISPTARKLMNIETVPVERRHVTAEVRLVGKVEYDETKLAHITAWVSGRLDRLFVNYTGIEVEKGHHLVYIYSEELYAAQEELIQALKNRGNRPPRTTTLIQPIDLVESSREKLRLLGLTAGQIKEIEDRGTPADHVTIYSPMGGVVIEKLRQEGDRVRTGDRIYTVADLRQVWVQMDAYESDVQWLRYGQEVEFTTDAYPGEVFKGQIAYIDRFLNKETRTFKVRVNVPNEDGRLKPEMFVKAVVRSQVAAGGRVLDAALAGKWISPMHPEIIKESPGNCDICGMPLVRAETLGYITAAPDDKSKPLVIPVSAALVTGKRAIVYVRVPTAEKPTFEGREIVLGPRAGSYYLVRSGLKSGELVVTRGNFKLDSALQISAKPSMMTPEGGGGGGHDHGGHGGTAKPGEDQPASQKMILPSAFKGHLEQVIGAYDQVTEALEQADLVQLRLRFDSLGVALTKVDAKQLTGHAAMLWREYSMLLGNDAVEGRNVKTLQDADRVYPILTRHIQRLREAFGLVHDDHSFVQLDVPEAFRMQLARLWHAYQPIGQSLANDDFPTAKRGVANLGQAIASIDARSLTNDTAAAWRKEHANLGKIATDLERSTDIKSARAAFALLSDELIAVVKSFGVVREADPIFELHCPMAFEGRGASWLQNHDQPRNPYYGARMLKCADRVTPIPPPKSADAHAEHNHEQPHP